MRQKEIESWVFDNKFIQAPDNKIKFSQMLSEFTQLEQEMIDALKATDQYFIDLQNKCALTSNDTRAWKKVSLILSKIKYYVYTHEST